MVWRVHDQPTAAAALPPSRSRSWWFAIRVLQAKRVARSTRPGHAYLLPSGTEDPRKRFAPASTVFGRSTANPKRGFITNQAFFMPGPRPGRTPSLFESSAQTARTRGATSLGRRTCDTTSQAHDAMFAVPQAWAAHQHSTESIKSGRFPLRVQPFSRKLRFRLRVVRFSPIPMK